MRKNNHVSIFRTPMKSLLLSAMIVGIAACSSPEEVMQSHYENGMELLEENDIIKASIEFRNALQIDDTFVPAWYGMSLVEEENEEWDKVIMLLSKVVELEPTHVTAQVRLGTLMMMVGQMEKAVEISETALLLDNQDPEVLALRAAILFKLEDTEGALDFANRALVIDPGNLNAIQILAAERFAQRDYEGALGYVNQSNVDASTNKDLMLITIMIYETMGDVEKAEEAFVSLINAFSEDEELRLGLVNFYVKHNNIDAGEREIRNLAELDLADYDKSIDVVRFLNSYRGVDAAEEELKALIQRGTDVIRYQLALSEFYLGNNKEPEARDVLGKIVERAGSSEGGRIARAKIGEMEMVAGNYAAASEIVNQILEIDGANINALEMRGSIYLNDNNYDSAIQDLRIVLSEAPDSVRASMLLARAYELNGSIELADDTLADALRYSENDPAVAVAYADFLTKQSAVARAEEILMNVAQVNPTNLELLRALARTKLMRQDWQGAQEVADAIKQLDDDALLATQIEGLALSGQQDYEQSIVAFRNAYLQTPGGTRPMTSLISAYVRAGKIQEAMDFLDGVLAEDENNYQALILKGQMSLVAQDEDAAVATFKKAAQADSKRDTAYMNLVGHYVRTGNNQDAMTTINDAVQLVENKVGLQLVKANIYEREQDYEAAIGVYEEIHAENANIDVVVNNLASLLSEHRADEASINRAQELAKRFRQSSVPHFKDTLGWIYFKVGDIQAATSILQDAVEQMPTNAIFRYHLGMSYMAGERNAAAAREFEEAVKLAENQPFEQLEEVRGLLEQLNTPS